MGKRLIGSVGLAPGSDEGTDLTTKGDIHGYSTSNTRIPIGDNDQILTADSSEALGLKWAAAAGGGTWETLASTKLTSSSANLGSGAFTAKEYLLIQCRLKATSGSGCAIRYTYNDVTTPTYDYNYSLDGGGSAVTTGDTRVNPAGVDFTAGDEGFFNVWVHNVADQNKTALSHFMSKVSTVKNSTGSSLWNDTSNAITSFQANQDTTGYPSGEWDVGSEVVVLGYDP